MGGGKGRFNIRAQRERVLSWGYDKTGKKKLSTSEGQRDKDYGWKGTNSEQGLL